MPMPLSFSTNVSLAPDVMLRRVADEAVLLNLKTEQYLGLDAMGTLVWNALVTSDSIQTAYDSLLAEFDVGSEQLRKDLEEFISQLQEHGLIEMKPCDVPNSVPDKIR